MLSFSYQELETRHVTRKTKTKKKKKKKKRKKRKLGWRHNQMKQAVLRNKFLASNKTDKKGKKKKKKKKNQTLTVYARSLVEFIVEFS